MYALGYVCMEKLVSDVTLFVLLQTLIEKLCQKCRTKAEQVCHILVKPWLWSLVYAHLGYNACNDAAEFALLFS